MNKDLELRLVGTLPIENSKVCLLKTHGTKIGVIGYHKIDSTYYKDCNNLCINCNDYIDSLYFDLCFNQNTINTYDSYITINELPQILKKQNG